MRGKGTYILVINLRNNNKILVGKLGMLVLNAGIYLYIGSAQAGFKPRIKRHLKKNKKLFWHIDYLLKEGEIEEIWVKKEERAECKTAMEIQNYTDLSFSQIKGFGSSDCKCLTHLFYLNGDFSALENLRTRLGFERFEINESY